MVHADSSSILPLAAEPKAPLTNGRVLENSRDASLLSAQGEEEDPRLAMTMDFKALRQAIL